MQAERYIRESSYVGDRLGIEAKGAKGLVLAVFAGLVLMLGGLRVLPEESTPLLVKVLGLMSASIALGAVGAYVGRRLQGWLAIIGLFILSVVLMFAVQAAGGGLVGTSLLMVWTFIIGMTLGPLVSYAVDAEGPGIVIQSLIGTTAVMLITGFVTLATGVNLSFLGPIYLLAVIGLCIFGLVGLFMRFSRAVSIGYSIAGMVIFGLGFLYKFFRLGQAENTWDAAVRHTMGLYLSFVNFFTFLLQFLLSSKRR